MSFIYIFMLSLNIIWIQTFAVIEVLMTVLEIHFKRSHKKELSDWTLGKQSPGKPIYIFQKQILNGVGQI